MRLKNEIEKAKCRQLEMLFSQCLDGLRVRVMKFIDKKRAKINGVVALVGGLLLLGSSVWSLLTAKDGCISYFARGLNTACGDEKTSAYLSIGITVALGLLFLIGGIGAVRGKDGQ